MRSYIKLWVFPVTLNTCTSGFVEEGRKRKHNFQDGKWWDIVHMGILDEEWKSG
jgi:hypothetical protein